MILEEGTPVDRPVLQVTQPSVEQPTTVFYLTTFMSTTISHSQILSIKPMNETERFRVVITDGVTTNYAMLATQLNDAVNSGQIKAFTVICVEEYITSAMNGVK